MRDEDGNELDMIFYVDVLNKRDEKYVNMTLFLKIITLFEFTKS